MRLPQWGRAFWQDPNDDEIFLAYASGSSEVDFITSTDGGETWSAPALLFPVEDFHIHNNFDTTMDRDGHIHCGFRFAGSGCYQFVGKLPGGGWTIASGIGPVGLVDAGDSGNLAKGFQGSLTMQENAVTGGDVGGLTFPAVKMVAKDDTDNIKAFALGTPFNTGPLVDVVGGASLAGVDGGFPIIYIANDQVHFVYYDEPNGLIDRYQKSGGFYFPFQSVDVTTDSVPFGPSMAIGSGIGFDGNAGIAFCCSSGQQVADGSIVGQTIYSHFVDAPLFVNEYHSVFDISNGTENTWVGKAGLINGPFGTPVTSGNFIQSSGVVPTGNIYGVGPNLFSPKGVTVHPFPGEGTICDFSFNDDGEFLFYYLGQNEWGKQAIGRFKSSYDNVSWDFVPISDPVDGLKYPASVSKTSTGGFSNMLFWGGFKALKHPTEPNSGGTKSELLVTQGQLPTYPSGGTITVWDVAESPALGFWKVPEWSKDYILTSGAIDEIEIFKGITALENFQDLSPPFHRTRTPWMFDDDVTSGAEYGLIRDGYVIDLEFDTQRTFDRIEILHRNSVSTPAPGMAVSGSMDGVIWTRVAHIPSGIISGTFSYNKGNSLIKYMGRRPTETELANTDPNKPSQSPITGALQPVNDLDPFVAKFLKLNFENTHKGSHRVYEIRFYGPAACNPEIVTWSDNQDDPPQYNKLFLTGGERGFSTSAQGTQGTLPPGFRTYGDFEWGIVASGEFTKNRSHKPTEPLPFDYDGKVPSGLWSVTSVGNFRGAGDAFSIRSEAIGDASGLGNPLRNVPSGGIQPGMSGVLEIDVHILQDETLPREGSAQAQIGRTVGFNIRSDVHIDDVIEFYVGNDLIETYTDIGWNTFTSYTLGVDEFVEPEAFTVGGIAGQRTLRWIYRKGAYDPVVSTRVYPFGAAWIDNIFGLDGGPLEGAPSKHRYGFTRGGTPFEISVINGYLAGQGFTSIHGFVPSGLPQQSFIHGFLTGLGTEASGQIHGYALGHQEATSEINGYLIGNIPIDPTGIDSSIYGFAVGGFGSGDMSGQGNIRGYLNAFDGFQTIHGFLSVESGTFISSPIKGYTLGWDGGVLGLGPNQKAIYGYVLGAIGDASGSIHGYLKSDYPSSSIHGYLGSEALVGSGGGLVGNPSTSNVVPGVNFIHGYLRGSIGPQAIHGYVKRPLAESSNIHGYVLGGAENTSIHGYLESANNIDTAIHGYASGVGINEFIINGYVFGVSGIINSNIHGYLSAVEIPNSQIWGTLIGSIPSIAQGALCPSHNFPLCPLPTIVLPTGFIN